MRAKTQNLAESGNLGFNRIRYRTDKQIHRGRKVSISINWLLPLVIILLLHIAVRSHDVLTLPIFTDENLHIQRAAVLYDFDRHPAVESHGKFLFYFVPGVFDLKHNAPSALFLGRISVALTSLLISAVIFALTRRLFNARAAFIALAIYALVPYVVFFERMALADSLAGLIATTLVWQSLRFAQAPSYKRALIVGLFMAMTPAAKLSMAFMCFFPFIVILIYADYDDVFDLVRRYKNYGFSAAGVIIFFWALVLVPAAVEYQFGDQDYVIYPTWLVDTTTESSTFAEKVADTWEKLYLLTSIPMALTAIIFPPLLLRERLKEGLFLLGWLGLAWLPAYFIVGTNSFQTRYLVAGFGAIAIMLGGGSILTLDLILRNRRISFALAGVVVVLWALMFALPFHRTLADDPTALDLPHLDRQNYIYGPFNGYGLQDGVEFLRESGERHTDDQIYVLMGTRFCLPDYFNVADDFVYVCERDLVLSHPADRATLNYLFYPLMTGKPTYLITDRLDINPPNSRFDLEELASFPKVEGDMVIRVWRVRLK